MLIINAFLGSSLAVVAGKCISYVLSESTMPSSVGMKDEHETESISTFLFINAAEKSLIRFEKFHVISGNFFFRLALLSDVIGSLREKLH